MLLSRLRVLDAAFCLALLVAVQGEVDPATCARAESRAVRRVVQEYLLPQIAKQKGFTLPRACPLHPDRNMCAASSSSLPSPLQQG